MNSFGNIYRLTSFGESHGRAVGGVIDGMPPRKVIDLRQLQSQLDRRRPGRSPLTSARIEADRLQILSGVMGYDVLTGEAGPLTDECRHGIVVIIAGVSHKTAAGGVRPEIKHGLNVVAI